MTQWHGDDPFSPDADPDHARQCTRTGMPTPEREATVCECQPAFIPLSRRQVLIGVGALSTIPVLSVAAPLQIPCVQEKQQVTPCRHKFCRHYAGTNDYYNR